MGLALSLAGIALLLATGVDVVRTVFDVGRGGGPITGKTSSLLWRGVLGLRRRGASHRVVESLGIAIVLSVVALWLVSVWMGWTLVLSGDPGAVVEAGTRRPASFWERAYFTGAGMFTLGNSEFQGGTTAWRLAFAGTGATGLLVVTLSITYLVPVVDAASERRRVAATISSLGSTPQEIILRTWDGSGVRDLHDHLVTLLPMLTLLAQRHRAYPVLHYFHSAERRVAIAPAIAVLDEALTIVERGLKCDGRPRGSLQAARRAIEAFLAALRLFHSPRREPPPPQLHALRAQGIPTIDQEQFAAALAGVSERRQLLLTIVQEDGWDWEDVLSG